MLMLPVVSLDVPGCCAAWPVCWLGCWLVVAWPVVCPLVMFWPVVGCCPMLPCMLPMLPCCGLLAWPEFCIWPGVACIAALPPCLIIVLGEVALLPEFWAKAGAAMR